MLAQWVTFSRRTGRTLHILLLWECHDDETSYNFERVRNIYSLHFLVCQNLTDAQVNATIDRALSGKRHQIGLTLNDVQTNLLSGLACKTCGTTGYTIFVYPPESWIELKAVQARREMLPFGLENVTPEMRLPYIHVLASPSRPEYLDANGM